MNQKTTEKFWTDETGIKVQVSRLTNSERMREKYASKLMKEAASINDSLLKYKTMIADYCQHIVLEVCSENKVERNKKGNFTWYNFDRSIKIETNVNERIEFDEMMITIAKEKLELFLKDNVNSTDEMIKNLIMDAFSTSHGKLDTKKVMSLIKHKQHIPSSKYPDFHEAIDTIEKSIRRPDSKTYFRVSEKQEDGSYKVIDLNFSSI